MASLRSKFCRMLAKRIVAPKVSAKMTIDEMRKGLEGLTKSSKLPPNTKVELITLNSISAEWICAKEANEDKVVLYLHGGGYNTGSPNTHRELAARISVACNAKVFVLDYRLAPEHPFPSALEDATSAYHWLLNAGIESNNIALAGDSAGGGLSIATSISLRDAGEQLPASIACISPWTDLEMSGESIKTHADIDPLVDFQALKIMAANYVGDSDPHSPLISPLYADLKGIPPLLIHVGSDEILLDDSTRIAEKAKSAGVDVTFNIHDQMWHVFHMNARLMPEARNAIKEIGSFIRNNFE